MPIHFGLGDRDIKGLHPIFRGQSRRKRRPLCLGVEVEMYLEVRIASNLGWRTMKPVHEIVENLVFDIEL